MLLLQKKMIILVLMLAVAGLLCAGCTPSNGGDALNESPLPNGEQFAGTSDNEETGNNEEAENNDGTSNSGNAVPEHSQELEDALEWEQVRFDVDEYHLFERIGNTVYELSYGSWYAQYFWIPDLGEGVYIDELDEFYLFSDQILSKDSRCVAMAVKIKSIIENWNGETSFSRENVLTSERDVKWVKKKAPESSYLEYNFGRYKARVFTNEDGTSLNGEKDVLLIDASAETLVGLHSLELLYSDIMKASDNKRIGEKWNSANEYIDYLGKTQTEIITAISGEYTLTEQSANIYNMYITDTNNNTEFHFRDGLCKKVVVPFKSCFPVLSGEVNSFKSLNIPFDCIVSSTSEYRIYFEDFALSMDTGENAIVPDNGMVEITAL
jgi:hypothetical protein